MQSMPTGRQKAPAIVQTASSGMDQQAARTRRRRCSTAVLQFPSHSRALSGDCTASRRLRSLDVGKELAVARPLVVVQRTAVGRHVHAANLAIVPKFARAAFLDECAPLVLEQALPRSLADVRVNAVLAPPRGLRSAIVSTTPHAPIGSMLITYLFAMVRLGALSG